MATRIGHQFTPRLSLDTLRASGDHLGLFTRRCLQVAGIQYEIAQG